MFFWNFEGIPHNKLTPNGSGIDADLYCQQLDRTHAALMLKYPAMVRRNQVILQKDNAPAHWARISRETLNKKNWK